MNYLSNQIVFLFEAVCVKYPTLLDDIKKRRFTTKNTGFDSRNLNTLDELGLLPDNRASEKEWRKFNLNDLLYLHVVEHCKRFNMDSSLLKDIHNLFYANQKEYTRGIGEVTPTELAIVVMLTESAHIGIKLYSDGKAVISDTHDMNFGENNTRPAVLLNLNVLFHIQINKFKNSSDFQSKYDLSEFEDGYPLKPIKVNESKLLEFVRNGKFNSITIKKQSNGFLLSGNGALDSDLDITPEDMEKLVGELGGYVDVTDKYEDGKKQGILLKVKKKI